MFSACSWLMTVYEGHLWWNLLISSPTAAVESSWMVLSSCHWCQICWTQSESAWPACPVGCGKTCSFWRTTWTKMMLIWMHLVWRRHNPEVDCICYSWLDIHYYPFAHVPSHSPWLKFGSSPTDWYRVPYVWTAFGWGPWSRLCCPKRQHPVREAESCQRWFWNHLYSHKLPSWAGNYIQCAQIHQVGFSRACRNLTAVALRTGTLANLPILMPRASFGCTTEHSQPKPWKQVRHTKSTPAQAKKTAAYVFKIYVTVHFRLG